MSTVLITGCSSGFGLETARIFLDRGWDVVATMRAPHDDVLPPSEHLRILKLDVTDPDSIASAVGAAGPIDVLVNNVGVGWLNAVEATSMETVRDIFETNTFSTIAMMKAVLPGMRERRAGVIVNISSAVTIKPLPLLSIYRASKAAVNALTEAAALELAEFGIRAHVILPGAAPATNFGANARAKIEAAGGFSEAYADFTQQTMAAMQAQFAGSVITTAQDVGEAAYRAATDPECPVTFPAGADAEAWWEQR